MNSEVVNSGVRTSREHKRYLSIGEDEASAIFKDEDEGEEDSGSRHVSRVLFLQAQKGGGDGKENLTAPMDVQMSGGLPKLGALGDSGNGFVKSPSESTIDEDRLFEELDAWLR